MSPLSFSWINAKLFLEVCEDQNHLDNAMIFTMNEQRMRNSWRNAWSRCHPNIHSASLLTCPLALTMRIYGKSLVMTAIPTPAKNVDVFCLIDGRKYCLDVYLKVHLWRMANVSCISLVDLMVGDRKVNWVHKYIWCRDKIFWGSVACLCGYQNISNFI